MNFFEKLIYRGPLVFLSLIVIVLSTLMALLIWEGITLGFRFMPTLALIGLTIGNLSIIRLIWGVYGPSKNK